MTVTDAQVLSVLEGETLTNQDIVLRLGDNTRSGDVRKVLKRLESANQIGVVSQRKTGRRGRPSSVWGVSQQSEGPFVIDMS